MYNICAHEHAHTHIPPRTHQECTHCAVGRYWRYLVGLPSMTDVPPAGAGHGGQPEAGGVHPAQPAVRARARAARRRALAAPRPSAGCPNAP